jgi:hypothetical protein
MKQFAAHVRRNARLRRFEWRAAETQLCVSAKRTQILQLDTARAGRNGTRGVPRDTQVIVNELGKSLSSQCLRQPDRRLTRRVLDTADEARHERTR